MLLVRLASRKPSPPIEAQPRADVNPGMRLEDDGQRKAPANAFEAVLRFGSVTATAPSARGRLVGVAGAVAVL